jgi:hypothetical protein
MALTGNSDGPPVAPPVGMVSGLEALSTDIRHWSREAGNELEIHWEPLITARAAIQRLGRQGRISANESCRILRASDGWLAVNLPRSEDDKAVGAVIGENGVSEPWEALEHAAAAMSAADLVARVRLLGLPGARLGEIAPGHWTTRRLWPSAACHLDDLRVVDLSSMWAGPLVSLILTMAGANVTKVESAARPDAARTVEDFYRLLHPADQHEVVLDFSEESGRRALRELLDRADVVIESSRPRALEQLSAGPFDVKPRAGRVWLSITGYGRDAPGRDWVAFGDDAAVAGGLVAWEQEGAPIFCGDAIADPVTGMAAAAAVLEALALEGGFLLDVSMARCAASLLSLGQADAVVLSRRAEPSPGGGWQIEVDGSDFPVRDPALPERWETPDPWGRNHDGRIVIRRRI